MNEEVNHTDDEVELDSNENPINTQTTTSEIDPYDIDDGFDNALELEETTEEVEEETYPEHNLRINAKKPTFREGPNDAENDPFTVMFTQTGLEKNLENLLKHYETDEEAAIPSFVANMLMDSDTLKHKEFKGLLASVISHTDEDKQIHKTGIARQRPKLGGKLVGEEAVLAITTQLGLRDVVELPLVNSGFRVTINSLSPDEQSDLDDVLLARKGQFGRATLGGSMSHNAVYLKEPIVNAFLNSIKSHNLADVKGLDKKAIRERIKDDDYDSILCGMLAASSPNGLPTNVPCVSDNKKCTKIVSGKTYPNRTYWVDMGKLTPYQTSIITRSKDTKVTDEELAKYQEDFGELGDGFYEFVRDDVTYRFNFNKQSIDNSINAGSIWARTLQKTYDKYINGDTTNIVKSRRFQRLLDINVLSQFSGWFKSIEVIIKDKPNTIAEDRVAIEGILRSLINDDKIAEIFEAIKKYIIDRNPVTIGVPNRSCGTCPTRNHPENTYLVPVDAQTLFFIHSVDREMILHFFDVLALTQL